MMYRMMISVPEITQKVKKKMVIIFIAVYSKLIKFKIEPSHPMDMLQEYFLNLILQQLISKFFTRL